MHEHKVDKAFIIQVIFCCLWKIMFCFVLFCYQNVFSLFKSKTQREKVWRCCIHTCIVIHNIFSLELQHFYCLPCLSFKACLVSLLCRNAFQAIFFMFFSCNLQPSSPHSTQELADVIKWMIFRCEVWQRGKQVMKRWRMCDDVMKWETKCVTFVMKQLRNEKGQKEGWQTIILMGKIWFWLLFYFL